AKDALTQTLPRWRPSVQRRIGSGRGAAPKLVPNTRKRRSNAGARCLPNCGASSARFERQSSSPMSSDYPRARSSPSVEQSKKLVDPLIYQHRGNRLSAIDIQLEPTRWNVTPSRALDSHANPRCWISSASDVLRFGLD